MILVVEDEPDVRATTVALLRILGYRSIEAESGAQAIEVLSGRQDVDILISDIGLPGGMDGRELAEAARKLRPTLPILLISGHAAAHYEDGATLPARMQLLEKPFRKNQLGDAIRSLIDSKD
ncbi:response regulator [Oceanibacterium hippocampi]|nr:response regulator [Oceanibacterium hippocampi]